MKDVNNIRKIKMKKTISKKEAIEIADAVKRGMSIKVLKDLEELKNARSKFQMAKQS